METALSNVGSEGLVDNTFQRVPCNLFVDVPADGNCLLASVALAYLITRYKVNSVPITIIDALRKLHGKNEGLIELSCFLEKIIEEFLKTLKFVFPLRKDCKNLVDPLRKHMVSFMRQQESNFSGFMEAGDDFNDYLTKMSLSGTWCGQLELQALSDLLGCTINVYHESAGNYIVHKPRTPDLSSEANINLYLHFKNGNHYYFALSLESKQINSSSPHYTSVTFSNGSFNNSNKKELLVNQVTRHREYAQATARSLEWASASRTPGGESRPNLNRVIRTNLEGRTAKNFRENNNSLEKNNLLIVSEENIDINFIDIYRVVLKGLLIGVSIETAVWIFSSPSLVKVLENYLLKYLNLKTPLVLGAFTGASINLASYFELTKYGTKAANSIKCFSKHANFFGLVEVKSDMVNQENPRLSRKASF